MRAAILAVLFLTGCACTTDTLPKQPDSPTNGGIVAKVGEQQDKADGRVAAAVTVAQENADKPEIVKAETGVALSYLPKPSEGDVAYARQRASKADPKEYNAAMAYGRQLVERLNANWARMEADQKEAKRVADLKDARIADLEKQLVDKDVAFDRKMWTILGAALVVFGGVVGWLAKSPTGAAIFIGLGFCCGAYPRVIDSPWFMWMVGGVALVGVAVGGYLLWVYSKKQPPTTTPPAP